VPRRSNTFAEESLARPRARGAESDTTPSAGEKGREPHPPGTLYVVATPIGNLGDLTPRAREVLGSVDLVAAEDTRHTGQLLQSCGIEARLVSLHGHNEEQRTPELLRALQAGRSIALVSDAGTPLISDPGYRLLRAAAEAQLPIRAVPGACAAIAALSVAALPAERFSFEGFLPAKARARRERLDTLAGAAHTLIFYEAPHRLQDCLSDMSAAFGADRAAVVARELTKAFETVYRGTLAELAQAATHDGNMQRGEIVILVAGAAPQHEAAGDVDLDRVLNVLLTELAPAQAAKLAAKLTGARRNRAYERALQLAQNP
jgi:16S rRNA (cytidine1402-2'-O)-methyltransferase